MNAGMIYAKTPIGEEAVRQSTRVVQRNLRMVLVQVDGKLSVGELSAKIGNPNLVEDAICELEKGGYIVPLAQAEAAWEMGTRVARKEQQISAISQFSTFGSLSKTPSVALENAQESRFSSFGKPVLPAGAKNPAAAAPPKITVQPESDNDDPAGKRRRPLARLLGGLLGILLLAVAIVAFYPYQQHMADIERELAATLQTPVVIDQVALKLLPQPHLSLMRLRLGEGQTRQAGQIAEVQIHAPWQLLFGGMAAAESLTVVDPVLPVSQLLAIARLTAGKQGSLRRISLANLAVNTGSSLIFAPLNGRLDFVAGKFSQATFETTDRTVLLKALPVADGIELALEGRAWKPNGLPVTFAAAQAKGLLQAEQLVITDIDATFLGGLLKGAWTLSWVNGLQMRGTGMLARVDLRQVASNLAPLLNAEGELSGKLHLQGQGADWARLWQATTAQIDAEITGGLMQGVNLGEAGRAASGSIVRAGSTKFDRLNTQIAITAQQVALRNIQLDAGAITASGQVVAGQDANIDGRLLLQVRSSVATTKAALSLSGRLPNPTLVTEK